MVVDGIKMYKENGCNGLVVVGGGSLMDMVKVIGVEVVYNVFVLDYEVVEGKKFLIKCIFFLIIIFIIVGIGSEVI